MLLNKHKIKTGSLHSITVRIIDVQNLDPNKVLNNIIIIS